MSNGPVQVGDSWYWWGPTGASGGEAVLLESTGLTLNGLTLWRLVTGQPTGAELLVEDGAMELLFDDDTGDVLYEG